ncbi:hypothetical protein NDU88_004287 [Pleurodeles waltl]|uniref:Uncharacterized protein n=1 Tax=Pleurodeles waltl TaxID=8319 RepID=A0AAV7T8C4_PLEWA|nr:hypothetical protein NDU88_004287 [Pleurodeles waltl]
MPVRPRPGEGPGQPDRHTGQNRPGSAPVTPLVTSPRRLSAAAGLVTARLRTSSLGPFSLLLVMPQQDLVGGPGLHHLAPVASPGLSFGFRPCLRSRCATDFNFTADLVGSSSSMQLPS